MIVKVKYNYSFNYDCEISYLIDDDVNIRKAIIDYVNNHQGEKNIIKRFFERFTPVISDSHKYVIDVQNWFCTILDVASYKIHKIYFHDIPGNCVDKFMKHILENYLDTINYIKDDINHRQNLRISEKNYHSSNVYEQDFSCLTKIKNNAKHIVDIINDFQEQITINKYTS